MDKEDILNTISRITTDANNHPTLIVMSGHGSDLGFCLPRRFHITAEEFSEKIHGTTLLIMMHVLEIFIEKYAMLITN